MSMCCVRVEKHKVSTLTKTFADLGGHHDRSKNVENASKELSHLNIHEGAKSHELLDAWHRRVREGYKLDRAIASNAIGVIELLCTYSPEAKDKIDPADWHRRCKEWVASRFGGEENIIMATTHMDESTPHFHAMIVPITPEGGLSAASYIGGSKATLSRLQTEFGTAVGVHFHLKRGKVGSRKKHKPATQYREELSREVAQQKEITEQLRGTPLQHVMELLGYSPERTDASEWIYDLGGDTAKVKHVSINVVKQCYSVDWKKDEGKKSPFDLVMLVTGMNFAEAREWLAAHVDRDTAKATMIYDAGVKAAEKAEQEARQVKPMDHVAQVQIFARRDDSRLMEAREYLHQRGLAYETIDNTKEWYATEKGGVAFKHRDSAGRWAGTSIRGMRSNFKQCLGNKTEAFFSVQGDDTEGIGVVESAIDAMAYNELTGRTAISVSGSTIPEAILRDPRKLRIGFDNDAAGDRGSDQAMAVRLDAIRERPPLKCKDWAEALLITLKNNLNERIRSTYIAITGRKRAAARRVISVIRGRLGLHCAIIRKISHQDQKERDYLAGRGTGRRAGLPSKPDVAREGVSRANRINDRIGIDLIEMLQSAKEAESMKL